MLWIRREVSLCQNLREDLRAGSWWGKCCRHLSCVRVLRAWELPARGRDHLHLLPPSIPSPSACMTLWLQREETRGTRPGQISQFTRWWGVLRQGRSYGSVYQTQPPLFARIMFFKWIRQRVSEFTGLCWEAVTVQERWGDSRNFSVPIWTQTLAISSSVPTAQHHSISSAFTAPSLITTSCPAPSSSQEAASPPLNHTCERGNNSEERADKQMLSSLWKIPEC